MKLNAGLEDFDSLLPVEVVVSDEGSEALVEIMKPVLVVFAVTTSLLVQVPILCQFPDIIIIRGIVRSYRRL